MHLLYSIVLDIPGPLLPSQSGNLNEMYNDTLRGCARDRTDHAGRFRVFATFSLIPSHSQILPIPIRPSCLCRSALRLRLSRVGTTQGILLYVFGIIARLVSGGPRLAFCLPLFSRPSS